jgi:phosphate transport system substrate-binding protein
MASELDYVAMPDKVQKLVRAAWKAEIKDSKGNAIWK